MSYKEKEIEEMAQAIQDCLYQWDSDAQDLTVSLAEILCEKGYGNVKQAVKEFAERIKNFINSNTAIGCCQRDNEEDFFAEFSCTPYSMLEFIDNLMTELYGGKEC